MSWKPVLSSSNGGGSSGLELIVQVSAFPYAMTGAEDVIICTGTGTINMISVGSAIKSVLVISKTGTITMNPDGAETIQQETIIADSALLAVPDNSTGWLTG